MACLVPKGYGDFHRPLRLFRNLTCLADCSGMKCCGGRWAEALLSNFGGLFPGVGAPRWSQLLASLPARSQQGRDMPWRNLRSLDRPWCPGKSALHSSRPRLIRRLFASGALAHAGMLPKLPCTVLSTRSGSLLLTGIAFRSSRVSGFVEGALGQEPCGKLKPAGGSREGGSSLNTPCPAQQHHPGAPM